MTPVLTRIFLPFFLNLACAVAVTAQSFPVIPANQLVLPPTTYEISFRWQGDSLNGQWEPHAALLLPVKFPFCPEQFYMQFDLGSPYSMFYQKEIDALREKYPNELPADSAGGLKNCIFKLNGMQVHAKQITVRAINSPQALEGKIKIIGTIGADFIDGRVVVLDYPKKVMVNGLDIPSNITAATSDFVYAGRSILLPAMINGKNTMLFFDTGSSAFELITDRTNAGLLAAKGAVPVVYPVNSWGRSLTAYSMAAAGSLVLGSKNISLKKVTYIEGASASQVELMSKMGIGGMIGNKLFIHHRLLLDTKNKKFAVLAAVIK